MMAAKLAISRNTRKGMQIIRNIKLILLSFHERFLNFRENIGISDTNSHENRHTNIKRYLQELAALRKSLSAVCHY